MSRLRNRGLFAVLVLVLAALSMFRVALRLSGAVLNLAILAVAASSSPGSAGRAGGDKSV